MKQVYIKRLNLIGTVINQIGSILFLNIHSDGESASYQCLEEEVQFLPTPQYKDLMIKRLQDHEIEALSVG